MEQNYKATHAIRHWEEALNLYDYVMEDEKDENIRTWITESKADMVYDDGTYAILLNEGYEILFLEWSCPNGAHPFFFETDCLAQIKLKMFLCDKGDEELYHRLFNENISDSGLYSAYCEYLDECKAYDRLTSDPEISKERRAALEYDVLTALNALKDFGTEGNTVYAIIVGDTESVWDC